MFDDETDRELAAMSWTEKAGNKTADEYQYGYQATEGCAGRCVRCASPIYSIRTHWVSPDATPRPRLCGFCYPAIMREKAR